MNTKIIVIFFSFIFLISQAQDIVLKKNGEEINAKVIEISPTEIKYKLTENLDGPLYTILKSDVFMIKYSNGTKDVFNTESPVVMPQQNNATNTTQVKDADIKPSYSQGVSDASKYYTKYKGAAAGNFIGGLFLNICALPIPIATGASTPQEFNLGFPNPGLFQDANYRSGYTARAKRIKQNKVWLNWGVGCATNSFLYVITSFITRPTN